jgi:pimeloyl-ACP methyl ester carboxylesterase
MKKYFSLLVLLLLLGHATPSSAVQGSVVPGTCQDGVLPGGALSRICVPQQGWNGNLLVWAHGYKAFNEPLTFTTLKLPDGSSIPDVIQRMGYAFATTSYRTNGLAILPGTEDIRELVRAFPLVSGRKAEKTFLAGASEGGIITTLLIEQSPELFDAGLAMCGPTGDFKKQIEHIGHFRVLFDYFFPNVIPGEADYIPDEVILNWETKYVPLITRVITANPGKARQLMKTSLASYEPKDESTILNTTLRLIWYSVFTTNDAMSKLGGNLFGNRKRVYIGSDNDLRLNFNVDRYSPDENALNAVKAYQTSGKITRPLITMHTTGDEVIPFWHQVLYTKKAINSIGVRLIPIPIERYGHCNFTLDEVMNAFKLMVARVAID